MESTGMMKAVCLMRWMLPDAFRGNEALLVFARQCRAWLSLTNFVRTSLEIGSLEFDTLTMVLF